MIDLLRSSVLWGEHLLAPSPFSLPSPKFAVKLLDASYLGHEAAISGFYGPSPAVSSAE